MRDILCMSEFVGETGSSEAAWRSAGAPAVEAAFKWLLRSHGYQFDRVWSEWNDGSPSVLVEMPRLSEPGPTRGSGEINYGRVRVMELQLRDRLGLRNSPRIGQYTRAMGYDGRSGVDDIPEGKLWVECDLVG